MTRKPMYENAIAKTAGLMASCNACDRIIFEDEDWKEQYIANGGYCKDCEPMGNCPNCGVEVPASMKKCEDCGASCSSSMEL